MSTTSSDAARRRRRVRLADAMLLGTIVILATGLTLLGVAPADGVDRLAVVGFGEALVVVVSWLGFAIVGAIIVRHQPDNLIGWACAASGFGASLVALSVCLATYLLAFDGGSRTGLLVAWVSHVGGMALAAPPLIMMFRYPTGRSFGPRTARLEPVWVALFGVLLVGAALAPIQLVGFIGLANPFAIAPFPPELFFGLVVVSVTTLLIAGTATLLARYRRGSWLERRQIGLLAGAAALVAADIATFPISSPGFTTTGQLSFATYLTSTLALTSVPVAIGIAIVRYRLYEIDRILRRTLVYGIVSAVLASIYVVAVLGFQAVLHTVTPTTGNTLATAGSTLLVAALFRPVRARAQRAVDRQFDRERYEASRITDSFVEQIRGEVELGAIVSDLRIAAIRTVRPSRVSCWLRGRHPGTKVAGDHGRPGYNRATVIPVSQPREYPR